MNANCVSVEKEGFKRLQTSTKLKYLKLKSCLCSWEEGLLLQPFLVITEELQEGNLKACFGHVSLC